MKFFFISSLIFFSLNIFAVEFKQFDDYRNNNALLSSDLDRLQAIKNEKHDQVTSLVLTDTINQYQLLLKNYDLLKSHLSLQFLVNDANENGRKLTSIKAQALIKICEGKMEIQSECLRQLNQFKSFISNSNLAAEAKLSINSFIDNYITESNQLVAFSDKFITSFNQNSQYINANITTSVVAPVMTVRITPIKQSAIKNLVITKEHNISYYLYALGGLLLALAIALGHKRLNRSISLKKIYRNIFQTAYRNKMKVRCFGTLDSISVELVKKIETPFLESLKFLNSFSPETHIKFKTTKSELKIETLCMTNRSILGFIEKEAEILKVNLENLQQAVGACGGELIYSNRFNTKGEITQTSYIISLPRI